jgi:oligopeptidase B
MLLADRLGKVNEAGVIWANDNRTLFYVTEDAAKRPYRLYRHTLGEPKEKDQLAYEEKDERFNLYPARSRSKAYLFITSESQLTTEVRYLSLDASASPPKLLLAREANHQYYADHHGDLFYIRTNDQGRNFRLVSAPVSDPRRQNWKEIIPHRPHVMLEGMDFFIHHYVIYEREDTLLKARITDLRSGETHRLEFPEAVYSAFYDADYSFDRVNPEFNTTVLRFSYQSFTTPLAVYDYDLASRERKLLKQTEVPGGYDAQRYQSERIYAAAADGTRIPISLVYKKGLERDGKSPLLLTGYGSYGFPEPIHFDASRVSLLDRGVTFAIAHIRGGGEMGKPWHDQGRMMTKKNTFTDFIAAAEHLIAEKYTAKDRIAINGISAGGLLMGAVTNLRPDLFKAVLAEVPFVDVLNSMSDASLPLTVNEYEEWGNPNVKAEYDYIKSYSPYDNIEAKAYPAILVTTSLNDSQVMYWEPAKYVAKLRALKTDRHLLLLKANLEPAGHGGQSGRYNRLREEAFRYTFILDQLGLAK